MYEIIMIQGTWLDHTVSDLEIVSITNYVAHRRDRSEFSSNRKRGGGVLTLIHKSIHFEIVNILVKTILEIQILELTIGNDKIILLNCYMQPARSRKKQIDELSQILKNVKQDFPNHLLILGGDFNIPSAKWVIDTTSRQITLQNEPDLAPHDKRFFNLCTEFFST